MSRIGLTRRQALQTAGGALIGSLASADESLPQPRVRVPPLRELVNTFEFEDAAKQVLSPSTYSMIGGTDHSGFERITLRPRMMINTVNLDLTTELIGQRMFAPILVGPIAQQKTFHADGELATAHGASAAKTVMVVSSRSSYPIDQIAANTKASLWYQIYPEPDLDALRKRTQQAIAVGCKAICITVGSPDLPAEGSTPPSVAGIDWSVIDQMRQGLSVPVFVKGIVSPEDAKTAASRGLQGIIVSNYRGVTGLVSSIEMLEPVVNAVGSTVPVLIDGSFRRGSDIIKALALGARAVMLGRPVMWGLAAYGADGVQGVLEMLQTELGRMMGNCGTPDVKAINRAFVKIHAR
jgi:isopentenyl diphosphate isomerase/L-lactate dehydrogenase-like FMN-dependent dehydrogenase